MGFFDMSSRNRAAGYQGINRPTLSAPATNLGLPAQGGFGDFLQGNQSAIGMGATVLGGMIGADSQFGDKGHKFKNVASSAVSMAGAGFAAGGPIGAAIGGGIGIVKGLLGNKSEQKAADQAELQRQEMANQQRIEQQKLFEQNSSIVADQHSFQGTNQSFFAKGGELGSDSTATPYMTEDSLEPMNFTMDALPDTLLNNDALEMLAPGMFKLKGDYHKGSPKSKKGDNGVKLDTTGNGKANVEAEADEVLIGRTILPRQYGPSKRIGGFNFTRNL